MQTNRKTVRVEIPFNPAFNDTKKLLVKKFSEELDSQKLISYRLQKSFVNDNQVLVGTLKVILEGEE